MLKALLVVALLLTAQPRRLPGDEPEVKPPEKPKPIVYPLRAVDAAELSSVLVRDPGAEPRFNLQYRATIGDRCALDFSCRATGGERSTLAAFRVHMEGEVTDVADGAITFQAFFTGWTLLNSADLNEGAKTRVAQKKKALEGAGARFKVSAAGVVSSLILVDSKGMAVDSEDADRVLNTLRAVIPPLPSVPVGKGASWEVFARRGDIFSARFTPRVWLMRLDAVDAKEARASVAIDDKVIRAVYPEADPESERTTRVTSLDCSGALVLRTGQPLPAESTLLHTLKQSLTPRNPGAKTTNLVSGGEIKVTATTPKAPAVPAPPAAPLPSTPAKP